MASAKHLVYLLDHRTTFCAHENTPGAFGEFIITYLTYWLHTYDIILFPFGEQILLDGIGYITGSHYIS